MSSVAPIRRLLFVVNDARYLLSHRLPIAVEARRRGWIVEVAAPGPCPPELAAQGFAYHPIHLPRGSGDPLGAVRSIAGLVQLFRLVKPDLVHAVTTRPVVFGGIAARLAKVPAIVLAVAGLGPGFRGTRTSVPVRWALCRLYRAALRHPNMAVVFQNGDDLELLRQLTGFPSKRAHLIRGSGVDLTAYSAVSEPAGPPVVLMASRLVEDKGPETFVEAARLLRRRGHVDIRFILAGEPDPHSPGSIRAETLEGWRTEGTVELPGYRRDVPHLIGQSHVVVLPSVYGEGLPRVLIEAAARGRAVVTTDNPGCRDAIVPNQTGLLVPGGNPVALADAIERLLTDPGLRQRFGTAGRALAEREFGIERVVARHMDIYDELLARSPA